jgi:hypothetical protein
MGVDHGRANVLVPKQFLDRTDIVPVGQQVRGKRMTKRVIRDPLGEARFADSGLQRPLK